MKKAPFRGCLDLSDGFGIFRGGNAEFFLELARKMMHCRILQCRSDCREGHRIFPNPLFAFLQFDAANIFTGGNLSRM